MDENVMMENTRNKNTTEVQHNANYGVYEIPYVL